MAGDKDLTNNHHRLSRLTAKLLRRPSTSSSAKAPNLTQTRSIPSLENTNGTDPSGDRRPVSSSQVPFEPKLPSPSSTRSPFARVKPLENLVTQSRVRSSRCSAEAVDKTCKSDSQSLPQPAPVKNAQERLENDVPVSRPRSSKTAPSSPPIAQSDAAADSTPVTEETKRSSSLRRVDEPESASPPKNGAVGPPCALSVRKSNSHSSAHRALNAVDESSQGTTLPSPLPPPSSSKPGSIPSGVPSRPPLAVRRQSLVPASQQRLIKTLLDPNGLGSGGDYFSSRPTPSIQPDMISRKIWVKRAGSSATLVSVTEEDLVDDLREAILKKYANSLGRTFDAPDILLKLIPREPSSRQSSPERLLGPEEHIGRTLDHYYPGGQNVSEALIIEVPQRRTPRPSPRHHVSYTHPEDIRPGEADEYFPPMHAISTPNVAGSVSSGSVPSTHHNSMSVITTGQLPTVPSPGSRGSWHNLQHRPKFPRQHTSSPTIIGASPVVSNMNDTVEQPVNGVTINSSPPSTSTPPLPLPVSEPPPKAVHTPPARVGSPRLPQKLLRNLKKNSSGATAESSPSKSSLLDGTVPPINVLIVEDNTINLKLLEAFMKRLKVRWQTAMNGREAVNKWRGGGFHLVLMDIQLPVMNGLEATREIRRLERVNNIGVFSKGVAAASPHAMVDTRGNNIYPPKEEDLLDKTSMFKSPVIIVALTASSLQSDRDEALAAGCNDFLTKPVNMIWLEKKVTEWGCMQALIDYEGWRKWRGFDTTNEHVPSGIITDSQLTASPAIAGSLQKPIDSSTQSATALAENRDFTPSLTLPKLAGTSVYHKGSGKSSSNTSSTSTIVPNGGNAGGSSVSGGVTPTAAGKNATANGTVPTGTTPSSHTVTAPNGKRGARTSTAARPAPS